MCIFLNYDFLRAYAQQWECWVISQFYFQSFVFFKESPYYSLEWFYQFTFPSTVQEGCLFSTSLPALITCRFFEDGHSDQSAVASQCSCNEHFFNDEGQQASFPVSVAHLYVFFGEIALQVFCSFFFLLLLLLFVCLIGFLFS